MKTATLASIVVLAAGLAMPATQEVHAAYTGIQRCRAPDGSTLYTDKPCAAFQATPELMPTELNVRLASESMRETEGVEVDSLPADAQLPLAEGTPVGRRSLASGCARTPTQLAMDLQGAMALRDVNRLAESWYWVGMTQKQAMPLMARLERLTHERVAATQYYDAQIGMGLQLASADAGDPGDGPAGILQVALDGRDGTRSLELNVRRYAGCYFVQF